MEHSTPDVLHFAYLHFPFLQESTPSVPQVSSYVASYSSVAMQDFKYHERHSYNQFSAYRCTNCYYNKAAENYQNLSEWFGDVFKEINEQIESPKITIDGEISLSTVVLNSRDCHENLWLPNFSHF